ncbi:MAG: DUF6508 domain-containing protein [Balneolaceae bacterium]
MILQEKQHIQTINGFSTSDWKPLFDLIPDIEKASGFGEMKGGERTKEGALEMPYWAESEIVSRFKKIVYEMPIIIDFDWASWDEGREMITDKNVNFDSIDTPTKCKLITAIVRNDRFCEGALASAFESGLIYKLLRSIQNQR